MNNPPTAVGGIQETRYRCFCRLEPKHPPTAVGGISKFPQISVAGGSHSNHLSRGYIMSVQPTRYRALGTGLLHRDLSNLGHNGLLDLC